MNNKLNKSKKEDGLPDIAEDGKNKIAIIIMMIIILMMVFFGMYFKTKTDKKLPEKPIEEAYTVQADLPEEAKKQRAISIAEKTAETPQVNQAVMQQQIAFIQEKQKELQQRLSAPLMLVNTSQTMTTSNPAQETQAVSKDANTQFMNQLSAQSQETATATTIGPLNSVIAEGNLIHAILESASNSDLPGFLRASVSEPVYSEDGTEVLVASGSRLIGQYKSGMLQGQSRIFVVWTRLITPNGISIQLGSAGVDSLGVAGIAADEINRHFWQRFGTASLLSLIGAGAANVGVSGDTQENSASAYRAALSNSFTQSANQSLEQESMIASTLKTYQGKPITVFVARDLNFQTAMKQVKSKINVY